jgi:hypothetical protein
MVAPSAESHASPAAFSPTSPTAIEGFAATNATTVLNIKSYKVIEDRGETTTTLCAGCIVS